MNVASHIMLFISSLLSPGEAGLAGAGPAFLFLEQTDSSLPLRISHERSP